MKLLNFLLFIIVIVSLNCSKDDDQNPVDPPDTDPTDTIPAPDGWKLVWNDEFYGPEIDKTKWEYEVNGDGGGNNELQYYTDSKENSLIANGYLQIIAQQKDYLGKKYTSARMRTKYKGDWTYGRFEVRAQLPYGQGLWPAIWMLPTDWEYGGWPESGEIDIMEMLGHQTQKIYGTVHWGTRQDHKSTGGNYSLKTGTFAGGLHTFTVEWDSTGFKWFVDNVQYYSTKISKPFDKRFHIILNVAVGGNWPGSPDDGTIFPQRMWVDYVRVYKRK